MLVAAATWLIANWFKGESLSDTLDGLIAASTDRPNADDEWTRLYWQWSAPPALTAALKDRLLNARYYRNLDGRHARLATPTLGRLNEDYVPALFPADLYRERFGELLDFVDQERGRIFVSQALARALNPGVNSWKKARAVLNQPQRFEQSSAAIRRGLRDRGEFEAFNAAVVTYRDELKGPADPVNYRWRREHLQQFTALDDRRWNDLLAKAPEARRVATHWLYAQEFCAAWLWCELTGGHPYSAPALGRERLHGQALKNRTNRYIQGFLKEKLPLLQPAISQLAIEMGRELKNLVAATASAGAGGTMTA